MFVSINPIKLKLNLIHLNNFLIYRNPIFLRILNNYDNHGFFAKEPREISKCNVKNYSSKTLPPLTHEGEFRDLDKKPLDPVFLEPARIKPTHGIVVCHLHFRSYVPGPMDFFLDFARRAAHALKMPCSGAVYLPTQTSHWTVIKGPFVHKKSQENFERKTHKRLLAIRDTNKEVVERWLWYLTKNCPPGIGMRVTLWEWEELGVGQKMLQEAKGKKERRMLEDVGRMEGIDSRTVVKEMADILVKEMEKKLEHEDKIEKNEPENDKVKVSESTKPTKS